jgi:hypothetical protein
LRTACATSRCPFLNSVKLKDVPAWGIDEKKQAREGGLASTDESRWEAWLARGVKHDRMAKRRALAAAAIFLLGAGLWAVATVVLFQPLLSTVRPSRSVSMLRIETFDRAPAGSNCCLAPGGTVAYPGLTLGSLRRLPTAFGQ